MNNIYDKNSSKKIYTLSEIFEITLYEKNTCICLKREIFKYFLDYSRIEKYKIENIKKMKHILYANITIEKQINKMKSWLDSFNFKELEYLTNLFFFINQINDLKKKFNDEKTSNFITLKINMDTNFYGLFLEKKCDKNKNKLYYRTKDKNDLLKWLIKLTEPIDLLKKCEDNEKFEFIPNGYKILSIKIENQKNKKKIINIEVNTDIIDNNYVDFISLKKDIFKEIKSNITEIEKWKDYKKINKYISIKSYYDCIIRFYYILKISYNRKRDKKINDKFLSNKFKIKLQEIDLRLGNLQDKIRYNLLKRKSTSKPNSEIEKKCYDFILGMVFYTAHNLKWLNTQPLDPKKGIYTFNLNRRHFDPSKILKL